MDIKLSNDDYDNDNEISLNFRSYFTAYTV
jgi:hypothetical protein